MGVPELALLELPRAWGEPVQARRSRRVPDLLVLGPSLGTSVTTLWGPVAERLGSAFATLGWDFPGHGASAPTVDFTVAELAVGVLSAVDSRLGRETTFYYAGDSLGGAVGLQLLLDAPDRIRSAVLCCTGPKIGEPDGWRERARAVQAGGTSVLLDSSPARWFAPGFVDREPEIAKALLDDLVRCDGKSYTAACEALAEFDVRPRLPEIATPVLAVAGNRDVSTPPAIVRHLAEGVQSGRLVLVDGIGHLAPAEAPDRIAELIMELTDGGMTRASRTAGQVRAEGLRVRREVLGDSHVDLALAGTTELTRDFQDLISSYAWGTIWARPGLDRRSRSLITLAALVARGHHEELAMHLKAARNNGLSNTEIAEALLQTAIYCGVPDANTAFRIAQQVLGKLEEPAPDQPPEPEKD